MDTCKNCDLIINDEKYCPNCGQRTDIKRIDFSYIINEISGSILQTNFGFFFTLKELFLQPGKSISEFLEGKRKNHFKPIAYVLLMSTLYFTISKISNQNTLLDDALEGFLNGAGSGKNDLKVPYIFKWLSGNYSYLILVLLPVYSLSTYFVFLKSKKNYLEHLVINAYITGQQSIFYMLGPLISSFTDHKIREIIPFSIAILYNLVVLRQVFQKFSILNYIIRFILIYFIYIFCVFTLGLFIFLG